VVAGEALSPELMRGRYLVESLGHCGECHTPRNALGGLRLDAWLTGAPNPSGQGRIPNITPAELTWSASDIANYLRDGFTPEFDSAGGEMAEVIQNMAHLPDADRAAIAAYLRALPGG
jgi:mono/diheme cytochrome c family protein